MGEAVVGSSSPLGLPFFASRFREGACFAAGFGGVVVPETEPDLKPVLELKPNRALKPLLLESAESAMVDRVRFERGRGYHMIGIC